MSPTHLCSKYKQVLTAHSDIYFLTQFYCCALKKQPKCPGFLCAVVPWIKGQPPPGIKLSLYIQMNIKHVFCRPSVGRNESHSRQCLAQLSPLPSQAPSLFSLTPGLAWCFPGSLNKEGHPVAGEKGELNHHRNPDSAESTLGPWQCIAAELWANHYPGN